MKAFKTARNLAGVFTDLRRGKYYMADPITTWNTDTVRAFLEERLEENQTRSDERFRLLLAELERDRELMEEKFHAANRYKETFSESINRISNDAVRRTELDAKLVGIQEKVDALSKTNWQLYLTVFGIGIPLFGALWFVINLQITSAVAPVNVSIGQMRESNIGYERSVADLRVELNKQTTLLQEAEASKVDRLALNDRMRNAESKILTSTQADANSQTDRGQLNIRVHELENQVSSHDSERRSNEAAFKAALSELEGQLCSQDNIRNLHHAQDLRIMSIIWGHIAGLGEMPINNAFYPQICNKSLYPSLSK